ncbi:MAG: hypothetical protein EXR02_04620 [Rhodospirillales bacterium]|nr:hypothetical protein [Rhodospirillales bacterium]MSP80338.1 hypothetical protein [Rhodospirillales bacterium]
MTSHFGLFLGGTEQAAALGATAVLFVLLAALGRVVAGPRAIPEAQPLYGWAAAAAAILILHILFGLGFSLLGWAAIGAGGIAAALLVFRRETPLAPILARAALVALPLLALAAAHRASEWDEFSHWAGAARYLIEKDALPTSADPDHGLQLPAYPFAFPILNALASQLAGKFLESAGAVSNVLLLLCFGALAVRLAALGAGGGAGRPEVPPVPFAAWTAAAFAVAAATILNPSFVQKIVLTNYADTATGVVAAFAGVLAWRALNALAESRDGEARGLAWQIGLAGMLFVAIKQTNVVVLALIFASAGLVALRDPAVALKKLLPLVPAAVLPPFLMYVLWRYHVATAVGATGELGLMPAAEWIVGQIPSILWRMATIAAKKGVYFGLMLVAVGLGLRALWRCRSAFDRLALIVAATFLGYNAFLLFAYVASFGAGEGTRAASFWRYNMHIALLGAAFFAYLAGILWRRFRGERALPRAVGIFMLALVFALPIALAPKLRFDLDPPKPHYRAVAAALVGVVPREARLLVFDVAGTGESGIITFYHLRRADRRVGVVSVFAGVDATQAKKIFTDDAPDFVLVHSGASLAGGATGLVLDESASFLLGRTAGGWTTVNRWPYPDSGAARP